MGWNTKHHRRCRLAWTGTQNVTGAAAWRGLEHKTSPALPASEHKTSPALSRGVGWNTKRHWRCLLVNTTSLVLSQGVGWNTKRHWRCRLSCGFESFAANSVFLFCFLRVFHLFAVAVGLGWVGLGWGFPVLIVCSSGVGVRARVCKVVNLRCVVMNDVEHPRSLERVQQCARVCDPLRGLKP